MDRVENLKTLTVREMIAALQALATDPASGVTLDTEVWCATIGSPDRAVEVKGAKIFREQMQVCLIDTLEG